MSVTGLHSTISIVPLYLVCPVVAVAGTAAAAALRCSGCSIVIYCDLSPAISCYNHCRRTAAALPPHCCYLLPLLLLLLLLLGNENVFAFFTFKAFAKSYAAVKFFAAFSRACLILSFPPSNVFLLLFFLFGLLFPPAFFSIRSCFNLFTLAICFSILIFNASLIAVLMNDSAFFVFFFRRPLSLRNNLDGVYCCNSFVEHLVINFTMASSSVSSKDKSITTELFIFCWMI